VNNKPAGIGPVPPFPVYLFDVDGTLVDSAPDICGAIRDTLNIWGLQEVSEPYLRSYIGRHLRDLFLDLGFREEQIDPMIVDYRRIYPARDHCFTRLYPGVKEALESLGGRKSTATTKGTPTTRYVLEKFGLLPHFDHVQGTDGFPAKPEPDVLLKSIEILGVCPEDCLLVGDAPTDMEAGRRAGVKVCAVTYGYGLREDLAQWSPDYWVEDLRELAGARLMPS
jgi:HAD superfamily hydrolase (TIGR01509 family)